MNMDEPELTIYDLHSTHLEVFLVAIEQEMDRDLKINHCISTALDRLGRRVRDAQLHARIREASTP